MQRHIGRTVLGSLILAALATPCIAAEPFEARVIADQVFTRCGAGESYYPTGVLPRDAVVEVYAQEDDWLAIRPLKGEFSLVKASDLIHSENRIFAKIRQDDSPAYVGSQLSTRHHVVQVKLRKDEPVEILSIMEIREEGTGRKEAWYRISPPAGEFRYIHRHFVEPVRPTSADPSPVAQSVENSSRLADPTDVWQKRAQQKVLPVNFEETGSSSAEMRNAMPEPAKLQGIETDPATSKQPASAEPPEVLTSLTLLELELRLSQELIKPAENWNLPPIMEAVKAHTETGETPLERGKARLLLEKIQEFNALYERKIAATVAAKTDIRSENDLKDVAPTSEGSGSFDALNPASLLKSAKSLIDPAASFNRGDFDPRYDGKGWLMPVISRTTKSKSTQQYTPPFALTDEDGNVLQFVSPSPGLNLRRYTRMEVGVYGQVSPLDHFTKPHLTAHRIVVLSRHEK